MLTLQEGFYRSGRYIYYGQYPKEQVSGFVKLSVVKPEFFKTDRPFAEEEAAMNLYDNHALTQAELEALQQALTILSAVLGISEGQPIDHEAAEERMGIVLPPAIKMLYAVIEQNAELTTGADSFLPLAKLYVEQDNLVFYKVKRTPTALSLTDGLLMRWYKKQWQGDLGDQGFLNFVLEKLTVKAIKAMPFVKTGRIKGELVSMLSPEEDILTIFQGQLKPLEAYDQYAHLILYNEAGALAWFRQNGFYADILIGCTDAALLGALLAAKLPAEWK